jgi:hypothetical protein
MMRLSGHAAPTQSASRLWTLDTLEVDAPHLGINFLHRVMRALFMMVPAILIALTRCVPHRPTKSTTGLPSLRESSCT